MNSVAPKPISDEELREVFSIREVREAWGVQDDDDLGGVGAVYGAKFNCTWIAPNSQPDRAERARIHH